jgi:hypothetical protein
VRHFKTRGELEAALRQDRQLQKIAAAADIILKGKPGPKVESDAVKRRREVRLRERMNEVRAVYERLTSVGERHELVDVAEHLDPPRSERTIRRLITDIRDSFGVELTWPPGQKWTLP